MGPFPGRLIHVSTGVMDGCRPSTSHTVRVDTRFMAQWMKSFRSCNTPITSVGWSAADKPLIPAPKTEPVKQSVQKMTPVAAKTAPKKVVAPKQVSKPVEAKQVQSTAKKGIDAALDGLE